MMISKNTIRVAARVTLDIVRPAAPPRVRGAMHRRTGVLAVSFLTFAVFRRDGLTMIWPPIMSVCERAARAVVSLYAIFTMETSVFSNSLASPAFRASAASWAMRRRMRSDECLPSDV